MGRLGKLIPRFSLRTLALFMLLVTSGMGLWWHWEAWYCEAMSMVHLGNPLRICVTPDRVLVVTTESLEPSKGWESPTRTMVWDAADLEYLAVLEGHDYEPLGADITSDGERVVTASADKTARIWETGTGRSVLTLKDTAKLMQVAFSRDGSRVATKGIGSAVRVWDGVTGHEVLDASKLAKSAGYVAFSPDGAKLALGDFDGPPCVWSIPDGERVLTLAGHSGAPRIGFSPDGSIIWSAGKYDCMVMLWDAADGRRLAVLEGHERVVRRVDISRTGDRVVTASEDGTVRIWDSSAGGCLAVLKAPHADAYSALGASFEMVDVDFSHDGERVYAVGVEGSVLVYRRRRPEWWWGVFWLCEFWLTVVFAGLFVWSVWRDRRALRARASE